jgi:thiol-disulfide isomerase/thioredoxin
VPVFIFQPEQSPWRWRLAATRAELEKGGAAVYSWLLTDVRDRFYFRPDATAGEATATRRLAGMLQAAAQRLAATPLAAAATPVAPPTPRAAPGARGLQAYRGDPRPPPLALATLAGQRLDLRALRGKLVLVNFWASWCPPCVHEMPSMQRLKDKLAGRPFEILAVNMGETERDIRAFLDAKVRIDFPVLLDPDGRTLKAWKVFVFPTSYVLDADGRIRLGVFGEIDWDSPATVQQLHGLLPDS